MVGRWHVDPSRRALVLEGGETPAPQFEILGNGNLRLLDRQGQRIEPSVAHDLTRRDAFGPFEPKVELRGMFLYFADSARFTECRSGRNFPVAMEAEFVARQRAYLEARQLPQTPVLVTVEARIAARPKMEGEGTETSVVVDRFVAVHPGAACERAETAPSLRNTYWRIKRCATSRSGGISAGASPTCCCSPISRASPARSAAIRCSAVRRSAGRRCASAPAPRP